MVYRKGYGETKWYHITFHYIPLHPITSHYIPLRPTTSRYILMIFHDKPPECHFVALSPPISIKYMPYYHHKIGKNAMGQNLNLLPKSSW